MLILLIFAFISGLITIFAPCIWPLLPLILATGSTGGHRKPLGVVMGILISFGLLTLTISYIVKIFPFDPSVLRFLSVIIIGFLGFTLLIPKLAQAMEGAVSRLSGGLAQKFMGKNTSGFLGGLLTGLVLGIVWTPCAGPILATIATLAATNSVNAGIVIVTLVYLLGVGIPLFIFAIFGRYVFTKSRVFSKYTGRIQQSFGIIMIITAILIFTNYDKRLQAGLLDLFPSYGTVLTDFESNDQVTDELNKIRGIDQPTSTTTKTDSELFNENYPAPEFTGITNWIGSEPLKMSELRGKVVLIDFWTYTCINCIRTLPYVTSWDEKYRDKGLVVIGVHTPEFEFEKNTKNVESAMKEYGITYAVAQDNDFATWKAYNNKYWPAEYLIDKDGNVRRTHFGEGEYGETEEAIQKLLKEAGNPVDDKINSNNPINNKQISPETYLGSNRMEYFYPNQNLTAGMRSLNLQKNIPINFFTLGGTWNIMQEYSNSEKDSVLKYNFRAQKVYLVMRSKDGKSKKVKVYLNNQNPGTSAGKDAPRGIVTVNSDKLYELITLPKVENKTLKIEFENGVEVFAFTFG